MSTATKFEEYRLSAIMFTDIAGFSKMMERSEKETLNVLKHHNRIIYNQAKKYNGNVIKTIGDAFLIDFNNTTNAVNCAIKIQNEILKYNENILEEKKLMLRIGIHLGDIWFYENDALGEGINIASRLQGLAKPGRICISKDVYNQISTKIDEEIISLGKAKLKNISKEIYVYEIIMDTELNSESRNGKLNAENDVKKEAVYKKENETSDSDLTSFILNKIKGLEDRISLDSISRYIPIHTRRLSRILDKLSSKGLINKIEDENGKMEFSIGHLKKFFPKIKNETTAERIARLTSEARKNIEGFVPHLISYLSINIGIFIIYFLTSFMKHPWFLYIAGGWGVGLVAHFFTVLTARKTINILSKLPPDINERQLSLVEKKIKNEEGYVSHLGSFFSVNGFLIMIYLITTPLGYPWFVFPLIGWGIGFFMHTLNSIIKNGIYIRRLKEEGFDYKFIETASMKNSEAPSYYNMKKEKKANEKKGGNIESPDEYASLLGEAIRIKDSILEKIKLDENLKSKFDRDIDKLMNDYIDQIKKLIERNAEILKAIDLILIAESETHLKELMEKLNKATNDELKKQYEKSIKQYENQKKAHEELENQKEIIYLRITQAVMSLKQMQLDMLNMKEIMNSNETTASIESFELRTEQLNKYVKNLKQSYKNLEREL